MNDLNESTLTIIKSIINDLHILLNDEMIDEFIKWTYTYGKSIHTITHIHNALLNWTANINDLSLVKLLIKNGVDLHVDNDYVLRSSCETGLTTIVKYLIKKGANISADNNYSLKWSVRNCHLKVVKLLLESYHYQNIPIPSSIITAKINDLNKIIIRYVDFNTYHLFNPLIVSTMTVPMIKSARKNFVLN